MKEPINWTRHYLLAKAETGGGVPKETAVIAMIPGILLFWEPTGEVRSETCPDEMIFRHLMKNHSATADPSH